MTPEKLITIILAPIISEKSSRGAGADRRFVFRVKKNATKMEIKGAVELAFDVKVEKVHVLNVTGKSKRFGKYLGKRSDWKKAYVKLKPGHDIDFATA